MPWLACTRVASAPHTWHTLIATAKHALDSIIFALAGYAAADLLMPHFLVFFEGGSFVEVRAAVMS